MKSLIQLHKFSDSKQIERWVENGGESAKAADQQYSLKTFTNQQTIMDIIMHAADISQQCRSFELAHEWTYLLFEEFFI